MKSSFKYSYATEWQRCGCSAIKHVRTPIDEMHEKHR